MTSTPAPASNSKPSPTGSAADYLTRQQDQARDALGGLFREMLDAVKHGVDITEWAARYPLITAGSAVVLGFIAGMVVTPAHDETLKEHLSRLREKLARTEAPAPQASPASDEAQPKGSPGFVGTIFREAVRAVGPILAGVLSGITAQQDDGDGSGREAGPATSGFGAAPPGGHGGYGTGVYGPPPRPSDNFGPAEQ